MSVRRRLLAFAFLAALSCGAFASCILGPKQDDPATGAEDKTHEDAGFALDSASVSDTGSLHDTTTSTDTSPPPVPGDAVTPDAPAGDTTSFDGAPFDAIGDAPSDAPPKADADAGDGGDASDADTVIPDAPDDIVEGG
jgi:hypothetical protein